MPLYTTHMWANVRNEDCTRLIGFLAQLFIAGFSLLLMLLLVSLVTLNLESLLEVCARETLAKAQSLSISLEQTEFQILYKHMCSSRGFSSGINALVK